MIIHGDCLQSMYNLINNNIKVDAIICDPPYGMNFRSNYRAVRHDAIINDDSFFLTDECLDRMFDILKDNSHLYIFCSFHLVDKFKMAIEKRFRLKNILIWEKNNTSMGDLKGDYAPKYEMILFAVKGKRNLNGGRDPNILKFKRTNNKLHPTQKPVDLIEYLINKSTNEGDTVLDFCAGSGSTGVACQNTNRNYILIEKEEKYIEVIKSRLSEVDKQLSLII